MSMPCLAPIVSPGRRSTFTASAALLLLGLSAPSASAEDPLVEDGGFALTKAIPHDVFLATAERSNPEHDFLDEHWSRVHEAFLETGVVDTVFELMLSGLDEAGQAEVQRVQEEFTKRWSEVDWDALGSGEIAFAQRLTEVIEIPGGAFAAPPEMVLLFKVDVETAARSFVGLGDILRAVVDEVNHFSGIGWTLEAVEREDLPTVRLNFTQSLPNATTYALSIGKFEDVLFLVLGGKMSDDVAALLTGESQSGSIAETARYRDSLAALPTAENGLEYFDMRNLTVGMDRMYGSILAMFEAPVGPDGEELPESEEMAIARALFARLTASMGVIDSVATVRFTEGTSVYAEELVTLSPDADKSPLRPVVTSGSVIEDFARYLPVETGSFSVSGGFDFDALYTYLLDTVKLLGVRGEQALTIWASIQEENGFDVRRDVTGWIEGTSVTATFEHEGKASEVTLIRVKDEDAAREKLAIALAFLTQALPELAKENPMLAMINVRMKPTAGDDLAGFTDVAFGPMPQPAAIGVRDGWLMIGSSADAVRLVLATAAGEHDDVRKNAAVMEKAIVPDGPVSAVSFTDHGDAAENAAAVTGAISMAGGMMTMAIPDEAARTSLLKVLEILNELAPVLEEIDFYDKSASSTTFDGAAWRTRSVTHYRGAGGENE